MLGRVRLVLQRRFAAARGLISECVDRVVEIEFVDRSVALASLAFTSLIPLGIVATATVPGVDQEGLANSFERRFDLDAQTARLVESVFAPPSDVEQTVSLLGLVLLIVSALSFTRALQRVYERAWHLPLLGVKATPGGLGWLALLVAFASVFGGIRATIVDTSGPVVSVVVALTFAAALWLSSPWILLSGRVAWRQLVPTALLTAAAMTILGAASIIYMPLSIAGAAGSYGPIGVAIALVSWFVATGFVITISAAVGAVVGMRASPAWPRA